MIKLLRRLFSPKKKFMTMLDIEAKHAKDTPYYRATGKQYTDHELWDIGWHDGMWHAKPNPIHKDSPAYMRGWKESREG